MPGTIANIKKGAFTEFIELHKISSTTTDDWNTKTQVFTKYAEEFAAVSYSSGTEAIESARETAKETLYFTFDYRDAYMDYKMRIKYRSNFYDIVSLKNLDAADWYIEAKAELYIEDS